MEHNVIFYLVIYLFNYLFIYLFIYLFDFINDILYMYSSQLAYLGQNEKTGTLLVGLDAPEQSLPLGSMPKPSDGLIGQSP